uniref:Uncharacterized protein n=1 Tax=Sipha flava TaxID=143950 RepID=A0A2S2QK66_9HEMI
MSIKMYKYKPITRFSIIIMMMIIIIIRSLTYIRSFPMRRVSLVFHRHSSPRSRRPVLFISLPVYIITADIVYVWCALRLTIISLLMISRARPRTPIKSSSTEAC